MNSLSRMRSRSSFMNPDSAGAIPLVLIATRACPASTTAGMFTVEASGKSTDHNKNLRSRALANNIRAKSLSPRIMFSTRIALSKSVSRKCRPRWITFAEAANCFSFSCNVGEITMTLAPASSRRCVLSAASSSPPRTSTT